MTNRDHLNRILIDFYYGSDYLMHHGTKGQKWGVRNYQNKDGSLTEAGKKRYGSREVKIRTPERMQSDIIGKPIKYNPEGGGGGGSYEVDEWEAENEMIEADIAALERDLEGIEDEREKKALQDRIQKMKKGLEHKRETEQAFLKDFVEKDEQSRKTKEAIRHSSDYNDVIKAYYDTGFLSHHGVKGQKWGIRRFQNKDGSWTKLGKERRSGGNGQDQSTKNDKIEPAKLLSNNGIKVNDYGADHDWLGYEKKVSLGNNSDDVSLSTTTDGKDLSADKAKQVVQELKRVEEQARALDSDARQIVVDSLYDDGVRGYGSFFSRDGSVPPTREEFAKNLKLESAVAYDDDTCELWYYDGTGMFGDGHSLVVEAKGRKLYKYASVQG